jgi:DUF1680 family protein
LKHILKQLPLQAVQIDDAYWNRYIQLIPDRALPYQWEILNDRVPDAPPSYALNNFRLAAGEAKGERLGTVFRDSDVAKWLEAVAYSLAIRPDEALEKRADEVIDLIIRAQCDDGYLNTYYTLIEPDGRWGNLSEGHELYCAGHMIEAAVAYFQITGKRKLLDSMCRFADLICGVFGPGENQIPGCPGHPEIELALIKLYHVTGTVKYLDQARFFVDVRGKNPNYLKLERQRPGFRNLFPDLAKFDMAYMQAHLPVLEQSTAEGHAVRAVYLYCAMADLAVLYDDKRLLEQCRVLWDNMVEKRMYITGSIGSSGILERFTTDFDLPNDTNYSETCASIGLALFGLRMSRALRDAGYMDVVERALYNTVRAGIQMTGERYFYVNPLEVWPANCMPYTSRTHVKAVRQPWFDVACCPTNIARTFASLGQYIYSATPDALYVNLFVQNKMETEMAGGFLKAELVTDFPKTGSVSLKLKPENCGEFSVCIRIPEYVEGFDVSISGRQVTGETDKGYFVIKRKWDEEIIEIKFSIQASFVLPDPLVRANMGRVALVRGPEVYCLEEIDNGALLEAVVADPSAEIRERWDAELLGGTMLLEFDAKKRNGVPGEFDPITLTAVPYGSWCNRTPGEMKVWMQADWQPDDR